MEKMQLGSPASPGQGTYLPSFLMGVENQTPARILSFSNTSPVSSPDFNRSNIPQKFPSGLHQQSPSNNLSVQQAQFHQAQNPNNSAISGAPPAVGLFDYLKNEKSFQTPVKNILQVNQSQQIFCGYSQPAVAESSIHNQSGFNQSRIMSPIPMSNIPDYNNSHQHNQQSLMTTIQSEANESCSNHFWITIFGFPQSATAAILSHFAQCGTILEKVCSSGNWIHLRFSSRLECDKALIYNGKIINSNMMIGVTKCNDESIMDKENLSGLQPQLHDHYVNTIRSLTSAAYKSAQGPTEVVTGSHVPKRATGIINKAFDAFFGW